MAPMGTAIFFSPFGAGMDSPFLSDADAATATQVFVPAWLEQCNSLYLERTAKVTWKLRLVAATAF